MGYVVVSETMLTVVEVFAALGKKNKLEEASDNIPLAYLRQWKGIHNNTGFYMHCVRQNPYEYLVMTVAELHQMLKVSEDYDAPLEELCRILAQRDNGDDGDDEDQDDDGDDAGQGNEAVVRNGAENEADARENHNAVPQGGNEPEGRREAEGEHHVEGENLANAVRNNELEIIDDIEIEVLYENEVQLVVENEVEILDGIN